MLPINFDSFNYNSNPFEWFLLKEPFQYDIWEKLAANFPDKNYKLCKKVTGEKPYEMLLHPLYHSKNPTSFSKPESPLWGRLIDYLSSEDYKKALLSLTCDEKVMDCDLEINCWLYPEGGFLAPHLDKGHKYITQLFYFNHDWKSQWGGGLRLLNSNQIDDVSLEVFPDFKGSILFKQSPRSWHAVTKQTSPEKVYRKVLQVILWSQE